MKILKTSDITDAASMPLKSGSLEFLQQEHRETVVAIVTSLLGYTPDPIKGYKLFGVKVSNSGSIYTVTDGYIFLNNEIFKVNGSTFNVAGGEQIWGNISNIPYTAADPVMFGDGVERNVHLDRQISFTNGTSGDLLWTNTITTSVWLTGDLKEVDCTNAYIAANFDGTGLGINERVGWAICNGNNGTKNRNGLVSIGYGTSYPSVEVASFGETTHILSMGEMPTHHHHKDSTPYKSFVGGAHDIGGAVSPSGTPDTSPNNSEIGAQGLGSAYESGGDALELDRGSGAAHNNMQPSMVTLVIQKI